jgi:hypothetical protein
MTDERRAVAHVSQLIERRVSADELRATLDRPIGRDERDEILALVKWFRRRYPTPLARLAYVRQAYRRWTSFR